MGTASHELQVDDRATFITPVFDTSGVTGQTLIHFLPDGDYHWRVRARGVDSVWGDWSEARRVRVRTYDVAGSIQTRGYPHGIDVRGDYAYVADGQAGLSIYRIADAQDLSLAAGIMDTLNSAYGISVAGHYAYLAYGRKQIQVVDIARFDSLRMLGSIGYTTGYGYDVKALDTATVVVANHGKFSIIDVTDPNFPILLYEPHAPVRAVAVRDSTAFLACEQVGLIIMSFSRLNVPVTLGAVRTAGNARDVAVQGSYAYVADGRDGLTVVKVSDPANPIVAGRLSLPGNGYANKVAVFDSTVYLADGSAGLAAIDISDPDGPRLEAMLNTPYAMAVVTTEDGRIFLTDRDMGLLAIQKAEE